MKRRKKSNLFLLCIIVGGSLFLTYWFINRLSKKAYDIAVFNIEKKLDRNVLKYYSFDSIQNFKVDDLISIEYNAKKDSIINVKYNIDSTNQFINQNINQIENILLLNNSNNWFNNKNYLIIKMPIGMAVNNLYFESIGPRVHFKIYYLESYYANLSTKVTNYGINNSLVELYLVLTIKYQIIGNDQKTIEKKYDYLLSANLVNGKVPSIYDNGLVEESNIVEIK